MSTTKLKDQARQLVSCHFHLIPLWKGKEGTYKVPVEQWQTVPPIQHQFDPRLTKYEHFGWLIPATLCVVDEDRLELVRPEDRAALDTTDAVAVSASGKKHYLFSIDPAEADKLPRHWGGVGPKGERAGELLIGGKHFAKVVGGKCSQSHEFMQWWDFPPPPLPQVFKTQGRDTLSNSGGLTLTAKPDISAPALEGARNNTLASYLGACWNTPGMDAETLGELAIAKGKTYNPPLSEAECLHTARSISRYEQKDGRALIPEPTEPADSILELHTLDELRLGDFPTPVIWHPDAQLGPEMSCMISGPPGLGKSMLMLQWVLEIGRPTIILDMEQTWGQLKHRLGDARGPITFAKQKSQNDFLLCNFEPYQVIVMDTKAATYTHKSDENSPEHWLALREFCRKMKEQGKLVIFLHHANADNQRARGSTEALAFVDVAWRLRKDLKEDDDGALFVVCDKNRHGAMTGLNYTLFGDGHGPIVYFVKREM